MRVITHMITTPTPLQERLGLAMAGIYTSDYQKVETSNPFLIWQNRTWRDMALTGQDGWAGQGPAAPATPQPAIVKKVVVQASQQQVQSSAALGASWVAGTTGQKPVTKVQTS